ncbi:F-box protein [Quillaja saponaria]|uniref:F-box protein n=1 Tax=Quillaja saponaria TaxID=32244 RepID=A0AAD7QGU1_QUISA|nr:F-box protein [Quillaja saponaria]
MEKLPRDIYLDILSRLPITSLVQIKGVCKAWRALAEDTRLPSMFHTRAKRRNPSLILHCDTPIINKLYYVGTGEEPDLYGNKVSEIDARIKSVMPEFEVVGSCNGLLCISDTLFFDPIRICNPFTGDYIELPKTNHQPGQEVAVGFGYHPDTMKYKMVRMAYYHKTHANLQVRGWSEHWDVQILTIGTNAWRSLGECPWKLDPRPSEALLNAALHWVTFRYLYPPGPGLRIISFDLAEEKFKMIAGPSCGSLQTCNFHLVGLSGCLSAAVCLDGGGSDIWVMKVYKVSNSWTKDYVIGAYVPVSLKPHVRPRSRIWYKSRLSRGAVQVLCILKNGEFLMQYENGGFVLYNPQEEEFKELGISGLPKWFATTIHVDSLFSVETVLKMNYQGAKLTS